MINPPDGTLASVTVVGAGLAGLSAARTLRSAGFTGRLTVIGEEPHRPYDRPPLSKEFLAGTHEEADLMLERVGEDLAAEWVLGDPAVALDAARRAVTLQGGRTIVADGVVIATGAVARRLPGATGLRGVHTLRTLDDARALRDDLAGAARLVVVGAGFIGAEVASTARAHGLDVTVVEAMSTPLAGPLGVEMGAVIASLHADHGVRLSCGVGVAELTGRVRVDGVRLADGTVLPAEVVVVGIGARPCVDWLAGSAVPVGDGVLCAADGGTGVPGVVAVGDCAAWHDPRLGRRLRVEHWSAAVEQPGVAVRTLLDGSGAPSTTRLPYFWSIQYGVRIQFAGHTIDGDDVDVEEGSVPERRFLAVYRRGGRPVAVLGVDLPGPFTRWRRRLESLAHHDITDDDRTADVKAETARSLP
jgi:NADPH-dependent 2,4-dienoyl-CoA reductase/sulfur reductase-like enzyme